MSNSFVSICYSVEENVNEELIYLRLGTLLSQLVHLLVQKTIIVNWSLHYNVLYVGQTFCDGLVSIPITEGYNAAGHFMVVIDIQGHSIFSSCWLSWNELNSYHLIQRELIKSKNFPLAYDIAAKHWLCEPLRYKFLSKRIYTVKLLISILPVCSLLTGSYFAQSQVSTSPSWALMVCWACGGVEMSQILIVWSPRGSTEYYIETAKCMKKQVWNKWWNEQ